MASSIQRCKLICQGSNMQIWDSFLAEPTEFHRHPLYRTYGPCGRIPNTCISDSRLSTKTFALRLVSLVKRCVSDLLGGLKTVFWGLSYTKLPWISEFLILLNPNPWKCWHFHGFWPRVPTWCSTRSQQRVLLASLWLLCTNHLVLRSNL